jgi:hypothetical protein
MKKLTKKNVTIGVLLLLALCGCVKVEAPVEGVVVGKRGGYFDTISMQGDDGWAQQYSVKPADYELISVGDTVRINHPVLYDSSNFLTEGRSWGVQIKKAAYDALEDGE